MKIIRWSLDLTHSRNNVREFEHFTEPTDWTEGERGAEEVQQAVLCNHECKDRNGD